MNGAVERCNGAWRYEFYETYDLPSSVEALNPILDSFQHLYNHHRPHGALAGQTPAGTSQSDKLPRPAVSLVLNPDSGLRRPGEVALIRSACPWIGPNRR
jgi:hypothetical protein